MMIMFYYKLDHNIVQSCRAITKIDRSTVFFTFYTLIYVDFTYVRKQERYDGKKLGSNSNRPIGSIEPVKGYINSPWGSDMYVNMIRTYVNNLWVG